MGMLGKTMTIRLQPMNTNVIRKDEEGAKTLDHEAVALLLEKIAENLKLLERGLG